MIICPQCKSDKIDKQQDRVLCGGCLAEYPIIEGIPCFAPNFMYENDGFDHNLFQSLFKIENKHFWFKARNLLIYKTTELLRRSSGKINIDFLEVGCGNGAVLQFISKNKYLKISGGDIFLKALAFCKERGQNTLFQLDLNRLPFVSEFDIVGFFDVLEHIDDDLGALKNAHKCLKEPGWIILTVPASQAMWSSFDVISKHKRRYSKKELAIKLERAGFTIERISSFSTFLLPFIWITRKLFYRQNKININKQLLADLKPIPLLNSLFFLIMILETKLLNFINLPIGSSIIVIAKK